MKSTDEYTIMNKENKSVCFHKMHLLWKTSDKTLYNLQILEFCKGSKVDILIVNIEGLKEGKELFSYLNQSEDGVILT